MKQRQLYDKYPHFFDDPIVTKAEIQVAASCQNPISSRSSPSQSQRQNESDLFKAMKPLITAGRIFLVIPYAKSSSASCIRPKLRLQTIPVVAKLLLIVWTCISTGLEFKVVLFTPKRDEANLGVLGFVSNATIGVVFFINLFIHCYFLKYSNKMFKIFDTWHELSKEASFEEDKWLHRLVVIGSFLMILPGLMMGMFFYALIDQPLESKVSSLPPLQRLHIISAWRYLFPEYNPFIFGAIIILSLYVNCARSFVPLCIIFFSRATSYQFRRLIQIAANTDDVSEAHLVDLKHKGKQFWIDVVVKHQILCKLVKSINSFLSPLIFIWILYIIYALSLQLYRALSVHTIPIPLFFFTIHASVETAVFIVTILSAAKVNTNAVRVLNILRNCPKEMYYETEVCRLEHQITTGPTIGFTGLGCFSITRRFILSILNVIFTMEIVLLQSAQSSPPNFTQNNNTNNNDNASN